LYGTEEKLVINIVIGGSDGADKMDVIILVFGNICIKYFFLACA
jgi:hypothetical protein